MNGIDVSVHNGLIDFDKVKRAGIDFVIIRAGYGKTITQKDKNFELNYAAAKAAGLLVGAYWYSYASSVAEAVQEAATCLKAIEGKQFEMPIYFDVEEKKQFAKGLAFCSEIVTTFCNTLEKNGYFAGYYTSRSALQNYFSDEVRNRYAVWVAEWGSRCKYEGQYGMWQYSSNGTVLGISGRVDMNSCFVNYPEIIKAKGLNGYGARYHTVKDGETLTGIAAAYGVSVDEIAKANELLKSGQVLKV